MIPMIIERLRKKISGFSMREYWHYMHLTNFKTNHDLRPSQNCTSSYSSSLYLQLILFQDGAIPFSSLDCVNIIVHGRGIVPY